MDAAVDQVMEEVENLGRTQGSIKDIPSEAAQQLTEALVPVPQGLASEQAATLSKCTELAKRSASSAV